MARGQAAVEEVEPEADETAPEPDVDEETAAAAAAVDKGVRGRAQVRYLGQEGFEMEILDELPEQAVVERTYAPSHLYYDLLVAVAADEDNLGKYHKIAEFGSAGGAGSIAVDLNKQVAGKIGEERGLLKPSAVRNIPEYEGWHFEFAGVKVPKKDTEGNLIEGERSSALYAKMVENTIEGAEDETDPEVTQARDEG